MLRRRRKAEELGFEEIFETDRQTRVEEATEHMTKLIQIIGVEVLEKELEVVFLTPEAREAIRNWRSSNLDELLELTEISPDYPQVGRVIDLWIGTKEYFKKSLPKNE